MLEHSTPCNLPLCRWSDEFERDVVGIARCQAQPAVGFDDSAVSDARLIEAAAPLLQFGPIATSEGQMFRTNLRSLTWGLSAGSENL